MNQQSNHQPGYALREWLRLQLSNGLSQLQKQILLDRAKTSRGGEGNQVVDQQIFPLSPGEFSKTIPVKRLIPRTGSSADGAIAPSITYVSAIAHVLAPQWGEPPLTLAQHLQHILQNQLQIKPAEELPNSDHRIRTNSTQTETFLANLAPYWLIQVRPPGWLILHLQEPGLAIWLQGMTSMPLSGSQGQTFEAVKPEQRSLRSAALLPVQFAHARCCALLRLAVREEILFLNLDASTLEERMNGIDWAIATPFPWLQADQTLRLQNLLERDLILQLIATADSFWDAAVPATQESLGKQAIALANCFEKFDAGCRVFGSVRAENLPLAQARLGLVLTTQRMLHLILCNGLGVEPPLEL